MKHHGPPPHLPRSVRATWSRWFRTRRSLRRRIAWAFGVTIALSMLVTSLVEHLVVPGREPLGRGLALLVTFVVAWGVAGVVAARMAWPIVRLVEVVRELGDGRLDARASLPRRAPAEVRELGEAIDAMAARIEALVGGQRELVAAVSHELRTPLARLRVALELARESGGATPALADAEAEIEALDALVGTLLAGARVDAGALSPRRLDLVQVAREGLSKASERTPGKDFAFEPETAACAVSADPALVERALSILLDNAVRHGGRSIRVLVTRERSFVVEDDGPGVPEDERERIFEPFVRGRGAAHDERRGVGLGLHLVRRIAAAHGASAHAEGGGTSGFRVVVGPFPAPA